MNPALEETIYLDFITSDATGAAVDADAPPTAQVFEDATDVSILSPTIAKRGAFTGNYRATVACTTGNGFEVGKSYNVIASATIGGTAAKAKIGSFQIRTTSTDSLVRSTTPGNALDVSATGEAGLDFNNVKQATAPTILSNIALPVTAGITLLAKWLGLLAGKTADAPALAEINATTAGAGFNNITDSEEALRDRGDTAWVTATGFASAADYTAGRAARLDFLDMAISAVPGGVPSISGTVSVAPAPTAQGFTTNLNYPANYLRDGTLRFAGGAMMNVAVRIASNTAGPNSALTFVVPTPAVAVAGVAFSVSTEDRHGAPAAPGGF